MKIKTTHLRRTLAAAAGCCVLSMIAAAPAHAALVGQLGILDLTANGGINPATGEAWKAGDKYHLIYVTTALTNATSTDIADYNAFVQADAASQTGAYANMGTVSWFAFGSTATTDARDNVAITGPVINISNNSTWALDEADMWNFGNYPGNTLNQIDGTPKNIWTGTINGDASGTNRLGDADPRRHWSHWAGNSWTGGFATSSNTSEHEMAAVSQELTVIPEPSTAVLLGLGSLALLRRRR